MKFIKKPVQIEAFLFLPGVPVECDWFKTAINRGDVWYQGGDDPHYTIKTFEGVMRANPGDYIIQGIAGEIYPCKPEIFEATYEEA